MQHRVVRREPRRRRRPSLLRALGLLVSAAPLAAGCAPSEEEIRREFDDYVSGASACQESRECGVAAAECPLGCWVAVRGERVQAVERKARELIEDFESSGRACVYDCAPVGEVRCVDGRCALSSE